MTTLREAAAARVEWLEQNAPRALPYLFLWGCLVFLGLSLLAHDAASRAAPWIAPDLERRAFTWLMSAPGLGALAIASWARARSTR